MENKKWFMVKDSWFMVMAMMVLTLLTGCRQEDDRTETVAARHWVEKTVAVVAPIGDAATKARMERTASWFLENLREAQMHDTLAIDLKIAWYDEPSAGLAPSAGGHRQACRGVTLLDCTAGTDICSASCKTAK